MTLNVACEQFTDVGRITASQCGCQLDVVRDLIGDEGIQEIIDGASDAVAMATGLRVTGRCELTVRPCSDGVCGCTFRCTCCNIDGVRLPGQALSVTQVKINGAVEDPTLYRLVDGNILVRTDGGSWPGVQNVALDDNQDNTFSITFTQGWLPWVAKMAATEIACDLLSGVTPGGEMHLPRSAIGAVMDGTTITLDPSQVGDFPWMQRLFGLYPQGPQPVIWSPEVRGRYTLHVVNTAS